MATYPETVTDTASHTDASTIVRKAVSNNVDTVNTVETLTGSYIFSPTVSDDLKLSTTISDLLIAQNLIPDGFDLSDSLYVSFFDLIQESFSCNDSAFFDPAYYVTVADAMVINDLAPNRIVALTTLVEIFNVIDELSKAIGATILESIAFSATFIENIQGHALAVDSLVINDSVSNTLTAAVILKDDFDTTDPITIRQILAAHISEIAYFGGSIDLDGDNYTFVLNTEGKGISTYTNYDFNSMYGDIAANSTGIYQLKGADDNGVEIDASFKTGLMDFGESYQKQAPYVYLALSNDGRMILITTTQLDGERVEDYYELTETRSATDNIRIQTGRGVKSRYWQYELSNVDGADFNLDDFEVLYMSLKRKI